MVHPYVWLQEGFPCLPAQSQEHGRDARSLAITQGELDRPVRNRLPKGGMTGRVSVLRVYTGIGRSATGTLFSSQMRAGSHWAHGTGMNDSGDAVVYYMPPVTTSSMTGLAVGQWWSGEAHPWSVAQTSTSQPTVPWLLLGTNMKSSEWYSDLTLMEWALGSSWCRTVPGGQRVSAVPGWWGHWCQRLALLFPLTKSNWAPVGHYVSGHPMHQVLPHIKISLMPWSRSDRRSPRTFSESQSNYSNAFVRK